MTTLNVDLAERSYPIYIGSNIMFELAKYQPHIVAKQVMIVTNDTIAPIYLQGLIDTLSADYQVDSVILPDGESYKNLDTLNLIYTGLLEGKHNRTTTLIALGGGVVGDMTGYAAASYQRGVEFIQVPTTVLSQVDSSVGGKTGVNHSLGKNMIGAFHQPRAVIIDSDSLDTLPDREYSAGLAEVIKYGLICDNPFYQWLQGNMARLMARDKEAIHYAIEASCHNKAKVVAQDEREGGIRAILNLGHTFGHAIETEQGYGVWLHGEAVAAGTVMAATLSAAMGFISDDDVADVKLIHRQANLPILGPKAMKPERYLALMSVDKKVLDGRLRLVLLQAVGRAFVTSDAGLGEITQAIIDCQEQ
ncbi:3-dehydroquinate synthase [Sinobacterium norvegicum]|uniref:3-dehydroquinate synthase n=1 Tax=Sinobacterium norvegicum TaxID=1641715 RepID=A0ABN8EIK2_9GAMM|nr:3-dehydroquinate synthase [Sinobacterium norvegicum]CAH0991879.1 3-dehydroquinate synthase [Sinobacterium norvegicum]